MRENTTKNLNSMTIPVPAHTDINAKMIIQYGHGDVPFTCLRRLYKGDKLLKETQERGVMDVSMFSNAKIEIS